MRAFLALMITLLIVLLIGISSYLLVEYQNHRNDMNNIEKSLKQERIEKQKANKRRLENKKRLEKQRRLENQRKKYNQQNTQQHRSYNKQNQHPKKTKYKKRHHRYSSSVKLKSDSKISTMRDNRLTSNLPIYGSYKGYVLTKPKCPKNRIHELNMYNECYVSNIQGDKFYFKKELVGNFNAFRNRRTINCHYNKKHGIMQDCRI